MVFLIYVVIGLLASLATGWEEYATMFMLFWPIMLIVIAIMELIEFINDEIIDRFRKE